ncbi:MAG: Cys-tRNA(Pro) deacylase [Oscillospiraceae bacterium]|nr:Cys-tRNA(Pro) deacylase [Oscillospiraceae bacterium]
MAQAKTNAMRILEKEKIPYEMFTYPVTEEHQDGVTVAKLCGQDVNTVFKTLVCKGNSKSYFVFVIPVAAELDLKKAARSAGEKSMEMIHVNDINKVTGYIRGGCSPIGMKKLFPTFFHQSALEHDAIIVSGGKRGFQIQCEPKQLASACKGQFADLIFS